MAARLLRIRSLLESASTNELLDWLLGPATSCRALLGVRPRLDHVGLLLAPGTEQAFRAAAAAIGFRVPTPSFASGLVARELGALAGVARVATTVAKQSGACAGHARVAIEAFIPDVDDARAESWIARGVASHVAVELTDARTFARVIESFPAFGLAMPPFMDGPCHVAAEDVSIAYYELGPQALLPRLEVRIRARHDA